MENKKKQFLRTVPGKFLLFLIINILVIVTFGCVCASAVCIQEDLYDITEEEFDLIIADYPYEISDFWLSVPFNRL